MQLFWTPTKEKSFRDSAKVEVQVSLARSWFKVSEVTCKWLMVFGLA